MSVNVELLDRTLAHIEANPGEWHQIQWRCRSGMCFAGHAALLAGGEWVDNDDSVVAMKATDEHPRQAVWVRAERVLGINPVQSDELFAPNNTLDDLRRIIADLKAGAA